MILNEMADMGKDESKLSEQSLDKSRNQDGHDSYLWNFLSQGSKSDKEAVLSVTSSSLDDDFEPILSGVLGWNG